tara:strand:- start:1159 stop:1701 length:543 start_codon:yes stop_codon:yes gene_type:complete
MNVERLEKYLNDWGQEIVNEAQELLKAKKGNTKLGQSIRFKVMPDNDGFTTNFYMEDYGTFLDKGVSGNKNPISYSDGNKTKSSPYKYTTKGPPIDILSKWIKRKGIEPKGFGRGRSKDTGQYISGFAYLISRKIKREGIKSISFFSKPLGLGYKNLQKGLLEELKMDIQSYLTTYYRPK